MAYGAKRDYRKIDIFVSGVYVGSTTWSRTCAEAVARFDFHGGPEPCDEPPVLGRVYLQGGKITAKRAVSK